MGNFISSFRSTRTKVSVASTPSPLVLLAKKEDIRVSLLHTLVDYIGKNFPLNPHTRYVSEKLTKSIQQSRPDEYHHDLNHVYRILTTGKSLPADLHMLSKLIKAIEIACKEAVETTITTLISMLQIAMGEPDLAAIPVLTGDIHNSFPPNQAVGTELLSPKPPLKELALRYGT